MIAVLQQQLTFEEFLAWDDSSDRSFELVNGVAMPLSERIVDYAELGGAQYIGSPKQPTVTVYQLVDGEYQGQIYQGDRVITSLLLPGLVLSIAQIIAMTEM